MRLRKPEYDDDVEEVLDSETENIDDLELAIHNLEMLENGLNSKNKN